MTTSPRLRLVPWMPEHLLALIEAPERFAERVGFATADGLRDLFVSGDVSPAWVDLLRRSSAADPWRHGFAVVEPATGEIVGSAGFKGPPDADGDAEIAYGIAPSREGRGYATETAAALVDFALGDERVRRVLAHTLPRAGASPRVLEKCGFVFAGEVVDPEDGPVWRWERARTQG